MNSSELDGTQLEKYIKADEALRERSTLRLEHIQKQIRLNRTIVERLIKKNGEYYIRKREIKKEIKTT